MNSGTVFLSIILCGKLCHTQAPVPDTTALVTLRDKPLGGNDSMPTVQVRYRIRICPEIYGCGLCSLPGEESLLITTTDRPGSGCGSVHLLMQNTKLFVVNFSGAVSGNTNDNLYRIDVFLLWFPNRTNILKMLFFNLFVGGQGTGCGTRLQLKLFFWRISGEGPVGALNKLLILDSSGGYGYVSGHHNDNPCGTEVLLFMAFNLKKISGAVFVLICSPITLTGVLGTSCGSSPHLELSPSLCVLPLKVNNHSSNSLGALFVLCSPITLIGVFGTGCGSGPHLVLSLSLTH